MAHWLGTDALGRDVLTRVIYGARTSLTVGFAVVLIAGAAGTLLGAIAAYVRGFVEEALMRATDLMFCFPPIILAMAIAAALGIGTRNTVIAMLVVWWPKFTRLARSLVIDTRIGFAALVWLVALVALVVLACLGAAAFATVGSSAFARSAVASRLRHAR